VSERSARHLTADARIGEAKGRDLFRRDVGHGVQFEEFVDPAQELSSIQRLWKDGLRTQHVGNSDVATIFNSRRSAAIVRIMSCSPASGSARLTITISMGCCFA
jgi:hypothetical protein